MRILSTSILAVGIVYAPNCCRAQCSQFGNLTCGYPGNPTSGASESVTVNISSIPGSAYPLTAYFYPQLSPVVPGWDSQATVNGGGGFYGGGAGITSEGTGASMVVRYQFIQMSNGQVVLMGQCPPVDIYSDALEQAAFNWSLEIVDCNTGSFRLLLTDNSSDPGDLTSTALAAAVNYQLTKDGNPVGSGALSSLAATNPPSFVVNGLSPGMYQMTLADNSASDAYVYCPSSYTATFVLPNAGDCTTNVALRAALQGALPSGTVMTDGLRAANLIPGTEPYSSLGYSYVGSLPGATIPASMLAVTGNNAIEDWVVVELRDPNTPAQVVYSKAALIQRDGDVIGTDGDPYVSFPVVAGNYYVVLRHRNHLAVMTGTAQPLATVMRSIIDFRDAATTCYGTAPRTLVGSVYCLWSGDATGNGILKYTGSGNDRDPILIAVGSTTPNATVSNVYDRRDTNLDGVIKYTGTANDRDIILTNVGSTMPNNTRMQQLP